MTPPDDPLTDPSAHVQSSRTPTVFWVLGGVLVLVIAAIATPVIWFAATYGCHSPDNDYATSLSGSAWLEVHPAEATADGAAESACDDDDTMALAAQQYLRGSLSQEDVIRFYRQELPARGWQQASGSRACWNKELDGVSVSLALDFSEDYGDTGKSFLIELSGTRDGEGGWCS